MLILLRGCNADGASDRNSSLNLSLVSGIRALYMFRVICRFFYDRSEPLAR